MRIFGWFLGRKRFTLPEIIRPRVHVFVAKKCEHRVELQADKGAYVGTATVGGKAVKVVVPPDAGGGIYYCHNCLADRAVQCVWCGEPIFVGEQVTAYQGIDGFVPPEYAVRYGEDNPPSYIGCGRRSCNDEFGSIGRWFLNKDGTASVYRFKALDRLPRI